MCECDAGIERDPRSCTYMSIQGPVVYFELVDKDLHRASDLVDLQQQLSFLPLVCAYKIENQKHFLHLEQQPQLDQPKVIMW